MYLAFLKGKSSDRGESSLLKNGEGKISYAALENISKKKFSCYKLLSENETVINCPLSLHSAEKKVNVLPCINVIADFLDPISAARLWMVNREANMLRLSLRASESKTSSMFHSAVNLLDSLRRQMYQRTQPPSPRLLETFYSAPSPTYQSQEFAHEDSHNTPMATLPTPASSPGLLHVSQALDSRAAGLELGTERANTQSFVKYCIFLLLLLLVVAVSAVYFGVF